MHLISWLKFFATTVAIAGAIGAGAVTSLSRASRPVQPGSGCQYWVAPPPAGNDQNSGTYAHPWASMEYASQSVPDGPCIVWFKDGLYTNLNSLTRRFTSPVTFKAVNPYRAIFERDGTVVELDGVYNMLFEGFVFRHAGPEASRHVVIMDRRNGNIWTENVTFRNNIFHDSYNNDLLKIHNGVRHVTIEDNLFYNQGPSDQHIDVNSVTDVAVQDNIFFNDYEGSGREVEFNTKHFIVIKDSNDGDDGLLGSRRITVRRNVFLNWQGENSTFVQVGNDGKPFYEAMQVWVINNLMIGNSPLEMTAAFGIRGARDVTFANNTVVGDLPAKAYAMWVSITEENLPNENLTFANNIWSDSTGTMGVDLEGGNGEFSDGSPDNSNNVLLLRNLYWNGSKPVPPGELLSPLVDDSLRIVADPLINTDHSAITLPRWTGDDFLSGNKTIRQEFERLVMQYGAILPSSPAVGRALPQYAPDDDILGNRRTLPDLGAFEAPAGGETGVYALYLPHLGNNPVSRLLQTDDRRYPPVTPPAHDSRRN